MNNEDDESEWITEEEEESLEEEVEVLSYEEEGTYIFKIFKLYLTFGTNYASMYYIDISSPYYLQITPS